MNWLDTVRQIVRLAALPTTGWNLCEQGCRINLTSFPSQSVIIAVDKLKSPISDYVAGKKKCDYVVLTTHEFNNIITFIEAKGGRDSYNYARIVADQQLRSSHTIFQEIFEDYKCRLGFDSLKSCNIYAICVMKSFRSTVGLNRGSGTKMFGEHKVHLRYLPDDRDIWRVIDRSN